MAFKLLNRARMSVSGTPGAGAITLGSAITNYQTFAAAGLANADTTPYLLEDGAAWEIGLGTYTSSGTSLARTTITASSNGGSAITATSGALVSATVRAADIAPTSLVSLLDVLATEGAGINGYTINWNQSAGAWEPVAPLTVPTNASFSFSALSDVSVTEGSGISNYTPYWNNTDSKWKAGWNEGIRSTSASGFSVTALGTSVTVANNFVSGRGQTVVFSNAGASTAWRGGFSGMAAPAGSTWSVTARVKLSFWGTISTTTVYVGLGVYTGSVYYGIGMESVSGVAPKLAAWSESSLTGAVTELAANQLASGGSLPEWFSITVTSGTLTLYYSYDGGNWVQLYQATGLTLSSPDMGAHHATYNTLTGGTIVASFLSWSADTTATAGG